MAIRFQCASCRQPIEIDDEWASKLVSCPFCRKTIKAPAQSELDQPAPIPMATPLQQTASVIDVGSPPGKSAGPQNHPNRVAIVAFALICLVIFQIMGMARVIGPHQRELEAFERHAKELKEQGVGVIAAGQQAMSALNQSADGSIPGWLIAAALLEIGMIGCWLAAVVCGLIGLRRPHNRRWAVSSLILAGLIPILMMGTGTN